MALLWVSLIKLNGQFFFSCYMYNIVLFVTYAVCLYYISITLNLVWNVLLVGRSYTYLQNGYIFENTLQVDIQTQYALCLK